MELLKLDNRPAEVTLGGVTFVFRTNVTVGDKFEIDTAGTLMKDGTVSYDHWAFYKAMIRLFVIGWKGVTDDGADAPYSYETLMTRLPADQSQDIVMKLGIHIAQANGFMKAKADEPDTLKND